MAVQTERPTEAYFTPAKADAKKRFAWWIALLAGLGFVAAGSYTVVRGYDARAEVRTQLLSENITTPEDASVPNVRVSDHVTAHVQADIIHEHALKATGGKSYAEMDREDPLRDVALTAASLRTALMSAALAWHTADLAIGVGAFIAAMGVLFLIGVFLIRPKTA